MDDHNVHHFWGLSPAIDLLNCLSDLVDHQPHVTDDIDDSDSAASNISILQVSCDLCGQRVQGRSGDSQRRTQVCGYDCRHIVTTICRALRHQMCTSKAVHLYVYEEDAQLLPRHMLLLAVLLDDDLPVRDRMELFLELFGNCLLREKTSAYLEDKGRFLDALVASTLAEAASPHPLAALFDLSLLKYQDKDTISETFRSYRQKVPFDMVKAWDTRSRRFYGDRFDHRKNLIDWDYHMRLLCLGTPGQDLALGSTIHFHHFRYWRMHGIAYELRDSTYNQPNRTMITTALGRTKEFKDRNGKDVGRSVAARGFWGDTLDSPYHCFGVVCEEPSFFKAVNQQFSRTAVDIAHFNVTALMEELRSGEQYRVADEANPPRAKVARGPTSAEDLEEENAKRAAQQELGHSSESATEAGEEETGSNAGTSAVVAAVADAAVTLLEKAACRDPSECNDRNTQAGSSCSQDAKGIEEAAALKQREAELNAAAWKRLARFKIVLVTGDLAKQLTGRSKFSSSFDAIFVGSRHVHLIGAEHKLLQAARPGALLVAESARNILQLRQEQVDQFESKVAEMAKAAGWASMPRRPAGLSEGHLAFQKQGRR